MSEPTNPTVRGTAPTAGPQRAIKVALIGEGIGPSLTPPMHEREGAAHGLDYTYETWDLLALDLPATAIGDLVAKAQREGYAGLNVTHPCKQLVMEHLDELDPHARRLGAVNTVVFRDGRSIGYNTDFTGFRAGFAAGLPEAAARLDALAITQIGAGGAGSAVAYGLLSAGLAALTVCDVDIARAEAFALQFRALFPGADISANSHTEAAVRAADGVINVTPLGMKEHPGTSINTAWLSPRQFVADVVYRPLATQLLTEASALGCPTLDGGRMAVNQAVDAFTLFTGRAADAVRMRGHFLDMIEHENARAAEGAAR
ncbi:shikimate dehydrogenase [Micrococcales bacterium 31B]|nr:shikimate dehydrogenase [Micrococcales bacterium 31B]